MLLTAIFYVDKTIYARALQVNQVPNGYDIISEFPQHHLDEDELGRCIGEYMVVDKNAQVALLCLKKHLERKIAEARVANNTAAVDSMLEALRATIQATAVASKHKDL